MYEITKSFLTNNLRYTNQIKKNKTKYMQHSTGTPGVKASKFIQAWNSKTATAETEFIIDDTGIYQMLPIGIKSWHCGGTGNNTHVGCEICEPEAARLLDANWVTLKKENKGNPTYSVTMLQKELKSQGYDPNGIDGVFGQGCYSAVVAYQKAHNLTADGSVGLNTLHSLQQRNGSYLSYNAEENQKYFEDVYNKAVFVCAYVLKQLGQKSVTKNTVCSHSEGYKTGIASNHADCDHLFVKHSKTMDDFRADVNTYMSNGILPFDKSTTNIDDVWAKAQSIGLFKGKKQDNAVTAYDVVKALNKLNLLK